MRQYARLQAASKQHQTIKSIKKQKYLNYRTTWTWEAHTPTLPTQNHNTHYTLTHDRSLNRHIRNTPAHYYSNFYNTLPTDPVTHHCEHTLTLTSPIQAHIPCNQTPYKQLPSPKQWGGKNPLARGEGSPIPTQVQAPPGAARLHTQDQPYRLRHMHPLQQRRG